MSGWRPWRVLVVVSLAWVVGCSSTSKAPTATGAASVTASSVSTSTVIVSSSVPAAIGEISQPADVRQPRFSDEFDCFYAFEDEQPTSGPSKEPVLRGPTFCDDPVVRAMLDTPQPWFPDPGNGRPCLAVPDMDALGPVVSVRCEDLPVANEISPYCDAMRKLQGDLASYEPDPQRVLAGLEAARSVLSDGDASAWVEKLLGLWQRPDFSGANHETLLNINGFGYAEFVCGFTYERIGEPPSDKYDDAEIQSELPSVPVVHPPSGTWIAIVSSVPLEHPHLASAHVLNWNAGGLGVELLDSRDYTALNDPYWVVAFSGLLTRADAENACAEILGSPAFDVVECVSRQL